MAPLASGSRGSAMVGVSKWAIEVGSPLVIEHSHGIDGPFIDDFPIKTSIYKGFSMAMLNNQMVYIVG